MNTHSSRLSLYKSAALLCCALFAACSLWAPHALASGSGSDAASAAGSSSSHSSPEDTSGAAASDGGQSASTNNAASSPANSSAESETAAPAWGQGEGVYKPSFKVQAKAACLIYEDSGLVVYEKNADKAYSAASLVKMLTAILTVEQVQDLDGTKITVDHDWVFNALYGQNASHADIRRGETLSVRELLYATLIPSGNEAALILSDHLSGGQPQQFVAAMQQKAAELGCTGTTFVDANGLSPDSKTTARDMCLVVREFKRHELLRQVTATPTYEMAAHEQHDAPYNLFNTNRLIVETSPYYDIFPETAGLVKGGKTGSLGEWQNFASWAESEDAGYICVVMNSPPEADELAPKLETGKEYPALYETAELYNWAFTQLVVRPVLDTEKPITEIPVKYTTDVDALKLLPSTDLRTLLLVDASDSDIQKDFHLPDSVSAPVEAGTVVGTLTLSLEGRVIGTADLLAAQDVSRNNTLFLVRKGQEFLMAYLKYIIAGAVILVVIYIAVVAGLHQKRQKEKRQGRR